LIPAGALVVVVVAIAITWKFANRPRDVVDLPSASAAPPATTRDFAPAPTVAVTVSAPQPLSTAKIAAIQQARRPAPLSSPLADELRLPFDTFAASLASKNPQRVAACFDGPRIFDHMVRLFQLKEDFSQIRLRVGEEFAAAHGEVQLKGDTWSGLHGFEIRRITQLAPADVAVVVRAAFDRRRDSYRWWLHKSGGTWKFYDVQYLIGAPRNTQIIARLFVMSLPPRHQSALMKPLADFSDFDLAFFGKDYERARRLFIALDANNLPPPFQASILMLDGMRKLFADDMPAEALLRFEQALKINPDEPHPYYLCAICLNEMKQPAKAIDSARRYLDQVGPNPLAYEQIGLAHEALGQIPQATEAYEKALADELPPNPFILEALARLQSP
jgi:hypothetical protein